MKFAVAGAKPVSIVDMATSSSGARDPAPATAGGVHVKTRRQNGGGPPRPHRDTRNIGPPAEGDRRKDGDRRKNSEQAFTEVFGSPQRARKTGIRTSIDVKGRFSPLCCTWWADDWRT